MVSRDYSDSGSDQDDIASGHEEGGALDLDDDILMAASDGGEPASRPTQAIEPQVRQPKAKVSEGPASASSTSQGGLRIKFRHPKPSKSERSSLSPPPPITLKFGVPSRSVKAEKAVYSSSEDEGDREQDMEARPPPSKKARKSTAGSTSTVSPKARAAQTMSPAVNASLGASGSGSTSHRKSYDWLIPSTAGASHHGPEGRDVDAKKLAKIQPKGLQPEDTPESDGDIFAGLSASASGSKGGDSKSAAAAAAEARRRSHKKRKDGDPPGPGKAWRKGLKKGVMNAREKGMETPTGSTPDRSRPGSLEGTPEADLGRALDSKIELIVDQDTPFVLADAATLGIPVFSKPIAPPRITLTNFPKVTPYFTPNNGGDNGPFPRREPVRPWKHSERSIVGIGGGSLKFKSWTKGPPSELSLMLQAEREAQEAEKKLPKEGADVKTKAKSTPSGASKAQVGGDGADDASMKIEAPEGDIPAPSPTPGSSPPPPVQQPPAKKARPSLKGEGGAKKSRAKPKTPRPSMPHSASTDSLASMSSAGGTDFDSVGGDATPVQSVIKGPRKSKLAQEIRPEPEYDVGEEQGSELVASRQNSVDI